MLKENLTRHVPSLSFVFLSTGYDGESIENVTNNTL